MILLISLFSFFVVDSPIIDTYVANDYTGQWEYTVASPDITYKGIMELAMENGEMTGSLKSEGVTIPLSDVLLEDNELSFKMNVQGFPCSVSGTFDGNSFSGNVSVEGYDLPITAKRK